jgi:CubicO group peptidase (beta-lactamase class C family)
MMVLDRFKLRRSHAVFAVMMAALGGLGMATNSARAADPPAATIDGAHPQELKPGNPHAHGLTDTDLDALRSILRKAVEDHTVPGVSLLLVHKGEVIFKEAFGNLTLDQKVLMASSSKPVTATLLMILVDQGKLALDDPIEKYLPEFKGITIKGKPPAKLPTVRHLLCNMSGLRGDFLAESLLKRLRKGAGKAQEVAKEAEKDMEKGSSEAGLFSARNRSLASSVRGLAEGGLATEPGAQFHYCTMGFNVAARVAEVAAKRPFEELVRTELFEPMGMKNTRYTSFGLQSLQSSPTLPDGESRFIMAGGGMTATLDDFAAFYQMHANGGTYHGRRIVSEQAITTMHSRQGKLELLMAGPYGNDYGLSFFLDRLDDKGQARQITHPGLFGTTPWLDKDRELIGVLFVQSNFLRILNLVRDLQGKVREIIPMPKTSFFHPTTRARKVQSSLFGGIASNRSTKAGTLFTLERGQRIICS